MNTYHVQVVPSSPRGVRIVNVLGSVLIFTSECMGHIDPLLPSSVIPLQPVSRLNQYTLLLRNLYTPCRSTYINCYDITYELKRFVLSRIHKSGVFIPFIIDKLHYPKN